MELEGMRKAVFDRWGKSGERWTTVVWVGSLMTLWIRGQNTGVQGLPRNLRKTELNRAVIRIKEGLLVQEQKNGTGVAGIHLIKIV